MIDDEWLRALGRAVLYFSFVESAVVALLSSLAPTVPSYMEKSLGGKKTAGQVGNDFMTHVDGLAEGPCRSELKQLAIRFVAAVSRRNDMLHAAPVSLGDYTQLARLTRDRFVVWSTAELLRAATEFEKLADDFYVAHHHSEPQ
ncbi:hypothetical protein [Nitrobacter sp. TKz-YC02]|uniref:hypothetical protein n=1 Tax=Nitrobacter sp. TKz-YC02 TaxID=3398704 RepID=UPI003CF521BC